jgi:hypothetical protein
MTELNALLTERRWRQYFPRWDESTTEAKLAAFEKFCSECWTIRHPSDGRIPFNLRDTQRETVRFWLDNRYTLVLKARQLGYSTLAAAFVFWCAFGYADRYIVMLSRTERESVSLLAKVKYGLKGLPSWMTDRGPSLIDDSQQRITFDNDSRIASFPSSNDPARGETVWLVIVDEWAFLPDAESAWASIEPITDVGGRCIGISTANGWGNFFHAMWVKAESGASRFKPMFYPWNADGIRGEDWYQSKAADTPDWLMAQEYPSNPDEAFIKSGRTVFDVDLISKMNDLEATRGYLEGANRVDFTPYANGNLHVYQFPAEGHVYVVGADIAEGLDHGDFSCAFVLDAFNGDIVAQWHGHLDPDVFGETLADIGWFYNTALVCPESNNHGLTTVKALQRAGYQRIFRQRKLSSIRENRTEVYGWRTTHVSKPLVIDGLGAYLRDHNVPCPHARAELRTYVRDENGRTSGSPHDDRVMALAIAVQMLLWARTPEQRMDVKADTGTFGWYQRLADQQSSKAENRKPLGFFNTRRRRG